jgi:peptidyl-prolyl cis-trans isomerase SurA
MRAFCIMLISGALIGSAPRARAQTEWITNGLKAVVHDSVVTLGEVHMLTFPSAQLLYQKYRDQPQLLQNQLVSALNENLQQLLQRQLILHDFDATFDQPELRAMVNKLINKDVDQTIEAEIQAHYRGKRANFIKTLQAEGVTLERYRQRVRDRRIIDELRRKNIPSDIILSPQKVEAYYLAHHDDFRVGEQVKLRMIVLRCPEASEAERIGKLAQDILAELKQGVPFAEMATTYSEGSQKSKGGDLGWCKTGPDRSLYEKESPSLSLSKYLVDTALSLQVGQHSAVMSRSPGDDYWVYQYDKGQMILALHYADDTALKRTTLLEERRFDIASTVTNLPPPAEFYLLYMEDRRPEHFVPLTEVRGQVEKELQLQDQKRREEQWIARLKKKTFVRVFSAAQD